LPEVVRADVCNFQRRSPFWKKTKEEAERWQESNALDPVRPPNLGPFIMDTIKHQAKKLGDLKRAEIEKLFPSAVFVGKDLDLTAPWESAVSSAV
jgi:hypothetical protein